MLSFRKIRIEDAEAVREIIKNARIDSCDFAFGNLFMWGEHYSLEVCIEPKKSVSKLKSEPPGNG